MKKELFEDFLSQNQQRIYRYLMRLTANEHDAMDLVQMVFISVFEHFERIDESTAVSYVYRIAHNKAMTLMKQKNRYITLDTEKFQNIPQPKAEDEQDFGELKSAMQALPPRLAAVVQLQYYDKMSYKEISEHLGISVKAVESLLVRAKRFLRKKILQERKEKGVE